MFLSIYIQIFSRINLRRANNNHLKNLDKYEELFLLMDRLLGSLACPKTTPSGAPHPKYLDHDEYTVPICFKTFLYSVFFFGVFSYL